ncbi:DUF4349 domain-containing protein [Hymenobacter sp. ASUV-10]|uniref:DUF4349 domain-containing protein n=1 Tax=Hymenobacter aranciens TaxID=3063996 RepID=A0ABT9BB60_9BACT|nr:DUF4349 domain-containing protein [Hymenobacter sp. ASUV-10]MDO7873941.1 DUF4349 domain-containing protein [Hymenobacter sp. ASUV-10]
MKKLLYPVLLGLVLTACEAKRETASEVSVAESAAPAPASPTSEPAAELAAPAAAPTPVSQPDARAVIYHGELNMAVDDFEQASAGIHRLLQQHRVLLSTAHETRADGQHRQEMTLKIPPAEFVPFVAALSQLGHVENKDLASADVTADVLEAATTASTKQAAATAAQTQLARATTPADISRLEEQTRQLRQEQETAQARLRQLGAESTWATLTLRYFQVLPTPTPASPMPDFLPRFLTSFYWGWSLVLGLLVVLANVWPLLVLGAAGWWGWRRWKQQAPTPLD